MHKPIKPSYLSTHEECVMFCFPSAASSYVCHLHLIKNLMDVNKIVAISPNIA